METRIYDPKTKSFVTDGEVLRVDHDNNESKGYFIMGKEVKWEQYKKIRIEKPTGGDGMMKEISTRILNMNYEKTDKNNTNTDTLLS